MTNARQARVNSGKKAASSQPGKLLKHSSGKIPASVNEFKIVRLRECPVDSPTLDTPAAVASYWRSCVLSAPHFDPERENLVVFALNTRKKVLGFQIISQGTLDTVLVRIPEVFRFAAIQNASTIIIVHNHPSGDPIPSDADVSITRDAIRAGRLIKVEVMDHVIIGAANSDKSY